MPGERPSLRTNGRGRRSEAPVGTQHGWTALRETRPAVAEGCVRNSDPGAAIPPPATAASGGQRTEEGAGWILLRQKLRALRRAGHPLTLPKYEQVQGDYEGKVTPKNSFHWATT